MIQKGCQYSREGMDAYRALRNFFHFNSFLGFRFFMNMQSFEAIIANFGSLRHRIRLAHPSPKLRECSRQFHPSLSEPHTKSSATACLVIIIAFQRDPFSLSIVLNRTKTSNCQSYSYSSHAKWSCSAVNYCTPTFFPVAPSNLARISSADL